MATFGRLVTNGLPARPMSDLAMLWFSMRGLRHRTLEQAVQSLACPLLIIHGRRDSVVPSSHGERLAAVAPRAELHIVEGGRHLDAHLVDAQGHQEVIGAFVQRLGDASSVEQ